MATGEHRHILQEGIVRAIDLNPLNGRIASGGDDGVIRLWNVQTGICEMMLEPTGPYAGLDITKAEGLSTAQVATLKSLGAITT